MDHYTRPGQARRVARIDRRRGRIKVLRRVVFVLAVAAAIMGTVLIVTGTGVHL